MDLSTILIPITTKTSCGYHRITLPMKQAGIPALMDYSPTLLKKDKVLLFNRVLHFDTNNRFILDLDDYWELPDSNPHKPAWIAHNMVGRICENIKRAACVLVTTNVLAHKVGAVRGSYKDVYVVPNALPFDEDQFTKTRPGFRLVYAGGVSHQEDIQEIKHLPVKYFGGLRGSGVFPLDKYMHAYDNALASLVPLRPGEFNSCKSNLKILEAGAKGIGCVASKVAPYYNDLDKDVMLYGFLKMPSQRELIQQGAELAKHVRKHYHLNDVNKTRMEIIKQYVR